MRWVESGMDHIQDHSVDNDFPRNSRSAAKASDVFMAAAAYTTVAEATDAPIQPWDSPRLAALTSGTIKSAIVMGNLPVDGHR